VTDANGLLYCSYREGQGRAGGTTRGSLDGFAASSHNRGMMLVNLCIFLGIPLAMLGLRWLLTHNDDDDNDQGNRAPWD